MQDNANKRGEETYQKIYDGYNDFLLSEDIYVLSKMLARVELFKKIIDVPGDIVECGVFKGTGMLLWLKLIKIYCPNTIKKVVGFDMFNKEELLNNLNGGDRENMKHLFEYARNNNLTVNTLEKMLECFKFNKNKYDIVDGDISKTIYEYIKDKPGFRISLINLDLDIEEPTYEVLNAIWDRIPKGGIIIFDEYSIDRWSESNGVDKFIKDKNVQLKCLSYTKTPSAYIIK